MSFMLCIKVDVDTDRGTKEGVPHLLDLFTELNIPATFLFSFGPDNTGRALKRIFRPGFLKKVLRTHVATEYGFWQLANGILWPGPHIGKKHADIMQKTKALGHEVGIHSYDHVRWQDGLANMRLEQVESEFNKAVDEFVRIFGCAPQSAGTAGWQANAFSLQVYDEHHLLYGSDTRGRYPFFPKVHDKVFKTLQIPTTLPTLDELLGRPEYPYETLAAHYIQSMRIDRPNILTIHAEVEGMNHLGLFRQLLLHLRKTDCEFITLAGLAEKLLEVRFTIPTCELVMDNIDGRSGLLAVQKC
jgi:undecaprenyl phosphate-alpha-L-ara4FN deformylase